MSGDVLVTSRSFSSGTVDVAARLLEAGYRVVTAPPTHAVSELAPLLDNAVAWIAGTGPVTDEHLSLAPRLRIVARYGVGFDAVDLVAAAARGIAVTNTPGANTESVADLALTLLLSSLRTVTAGNRRVRAGDWNALRGREIASLTVGVAGFGRIGRAFADRVLALGGRVLAFDPFLPAETKMRPGVSLAANAAALASCHAVSLHAPGGQRIVTADWLHGARDLALINTARADLVDESAVADALRTGRLASYAADTLDAEGHDADAGPLLAADLADRVILTPHLGAQTVDAVDRMGIGAVQNVLAALAGAPLPDPVTVPPAPTSPGKALA